MGRLVIDESRINLNLTRVNDRAPKGRFQDRSLDLGYAAVAYNGPAASQLAQSFLATLVVLQVLETVQAALDVYPSSLQGHRQGQLLCQINLQLLQVSFNFNEPDTSCRSP